MYDKEKAGWSRLGETFRPLLGERLGSSLIEQSSCQTCHATNGIDATDGRTTESIRNTCRIVAASLPPFCNKDHSGL